MSKANIFTAPAILTRIAYLKDGGVSLGFSTNELSDEEKVIVSKFYQKFGYIVFKENKIEPIDIPKEDADFEGASPSKRFRGVLFVYWKQKPRPKPEFDTFYRQEMEKLIDHYKDKLD